jgi:hypothetical protein
MSIFVKCQCGHEFQAADQYAGKRVRCPTCKEPLSVPDPNAATEIVLEEDAPTYAVRLEDAALPAQRVGLNDGVKRGRLCNVMGFGLVRGAVRRAALAQDCSYALAVIGRIVFKLDLNGQGEFCQLAAHEDDITAVAASPDGRHAASGDRAGNIMLWDAVERRGLRWLAGHNGRVNALAFAPSAAFLASVGDDATVRFWEVPGGKELVRCRDEKAVTSAVYSRDGALLLTGGCRGAMTLWDVRRARMIQDMESQFRGEVFTVAFSGDGERVMAAARNGPEVDLCYWKRSDNIDKVRYRRPVLVEKFRHINAVAFLPEGTHCLATGDPHEEYDPHERADHWTVPTMEIELSRGAFGMSSSFHSLLRFRDEPIPVPTAECIVLSADGEHHLVGFSDATVGFQ